MKPSWRLVLAGLGVSLAAGPRLAAQEPAPSAGVQIGGFVDLYYDWNGNHPLDRNNFFSGAGVAARRSGEVSLDMAALEIQRDPAPVGFHLLVGAGDTLDVLHSGEMVNKDTFRNVYQASVSYAVPVGSGLRLEAGIFPSHIGFESAFPRDTWNYTGSWAASFSPYYQTGVKAVYTFSEHWSGELHILNGWQIIGDNNGAKSVGTRIAWTSSRATIALNGWYGPELPNDNKDLRTLIDLVATVKATPSLDLALETYRGRQEQPGGAATQDWTAVVGFAHYRFTPVWAMAGRLERFADPDGGISGLRQRLEEATWTLEVHPHEKATLKLEARYDRSTRQVFTGDAEGTARRNQLLFVLGSIFTF